MIFLKSLLNCMCGIYITLAKVLGKEETGAPLMLCKD